MESVHLAQVIYLFVDGQVSAEFSFDEFEAHIDRQTELPGAPARSSVCRAGFAQIGPDLRIEGLVFFLLQVDEFGRPDRNFNIPLPYLAKNAGPGPDLGFGPVPMACRGSCSVPWQANNLWDPTQAGTVNPLDALVAAVAANQLELDPQPQPISASGEASSDEPRAMIEALTVEHSRQLVELQSRHEDELSAQQQLMDAKLGLYRQEIARLRAELVELHTPTENLSGSAG